MCTAHTYPGNPLSASAYGLPITDNARFFGTVNLVVGLLRGALHRAAVQAHTGVVGGSQPSWPVRQDRPAAPGY